MSVGRRRFMLLTPSRPPHIHLNSSMSLFTSIRLFPSMVVSTPIRLYPSIASPLQLVPRASRQEACLEAACASHERPLAQAVAAHFMSMCVCDSEASSRSYREWRRHAFRATLVPRGLTLQMKPHCPSKLICINPFAPPPPHLPPTHCIRHDFAETAGAIITCAHMC